jgi:hypothetical protein
VTKRNCLPQHRSTKALGIPTQFDLAIGAAQRLYASCTGNSQQFWGALKYPGRHGRISNRSPNEKDIAGKNRADSGANRAGKSGQEAERVEKPRHAKPTDSRRAKRVNRQCLAHGRGSDSVTRQEIQEIKPQISRIWAIRRGSLAAEKEMLDAAPAAFHKGLPPSSTYAAVPE